MLKTTNLTYEYKGYNELGFPNMNVERGSSLLINGDSGCGKTTLLHLVAGLRQPTAGQIVINNQETSSFSPSEMDRFRGQYIGMIFQQSYFIQSLSILDNLMLSPSAIDRDWALDVANRLQICELLNRRCNQLSVGQQQRASIARALMNQPSLILADEPTSSLDNNNCRKVINLLQEEANAQNATLVIVSHDERLKSEISNILELS